MANDGRCGDCLHTETGTCGRIPVKVSVKGTVESASLFACFAHSQRTFVRDQTHEGQQADTETEVKAVSEMPVYPEGHTPGEYP